MLKMGSVVCRSRPLIQFRVQQEFHSVYQNLIFNNHFVIAYGKKHQVPVMGEARSMSETMWAMGKSRQSSTSLCLIPIMLLGVNVHGTSDKLFHFYLQEYMWKKDIGIFFI